MQGTSVIREKVVPQVNLVIPPVVNRLISVGELRAVAIKHLAELSVEHDFFCHFFSKRKTCHAPYFFYFLSTTDCFSGQFYFNSLFCTSQFSFVLFSQEKKMS